MQLEKYAELLNQKKAELTSRTEGIQADITNRDTSKKFSQQASDRGNDDVLAALNAEAKEELVAIEKALLRIEKGQFGLCTACGGTISEERLTALPFAELCRNCAAEAE